MSLGAVRSLALRQVGGPWTSPAAEGRGTEARGGPGGKSGGQSWRKAASPSAGAGVEVVAAPEKSLSSVMREREGSDSVVGERGRVCKGVGAGSQLVIFLWLLLLL